MDQHITILRDLLMIMSFSGAFALLFHYLKLPLLLGYMAGGFLVGPHSLIHLVPESVSLDQIGELGVIFLMFYIGLEFDIMKLKKIFSQSAFWLIFQVVGMMIIGILISDLLGWTGLNGIFLGATLSVSSTMVTFPLLKSKNALNTEYAQCSIGALILEDILSIVLLVVLPTIASRGHVDTEQIKSSSLLIGVFVVVVFFFGKILAPFLVKALFRSSSKEVLVVTAIGFTTAICLLSKNFNLSPTLGAFLSGSILSQTHISEEIDKSTESLRDVFGAVFFTVTGMMIDMSAIARLWHVILLLSILTFVGKTLIGTVSLFLLGKSPETSFKAALANAQIGEFSFVIATIGMSLGVLNKDFISIIVGVSLFTILLCSIFSKKAESIYQSIANKCPSFLTELGTAYHNLLVKIKNNSSKGEVLRISLSKMIFAFIWLLMLCGVLYCSAKVAIFIQTGDSANILKYVEDVIETFNSIFGKNAMPPENISSLATGTTQSLIWITAFFLCIPFLAGIVKNIQMIFKSLLKKSLDKHTQNELLKNKAFSVIHTILTTTAIFIFSGVFLSISAPYMPEGIPLMIFGIAAAVLALISWKKISNINDKIEMAFIESFNDKIETQEQINRRSLLKKASKDSEWLVDVQEIIAKPNYEIIGKQISEIKLRETTGATLVALNRSGMTTYRLSSNTQIFPNDHMIVVGTKEQLEKASSFLKVESSDNRVERTKNAQFDVLPFCIGSDKNLVGKLLIDLDLRGKCGVNVVSIRRDNTDIADIQPNIELRENDILLLVGAHRSIELFKEIFLKKEQVPDTSPAPAS